MASLFVQSAVRTGAPPFGPSVSREEQVAEGLLARFSDGAEEGTINSTSLGSTSHGPPSPRYRMMCSGSPRKLRNVIDLC